MFFSSIKEINRLISKGMSYYWEKLTFSKLRFSRKEKLKKCASFEEQKGTRYMWGIVHFGNYRFQLSFVYKTVSQISFKGTLTQIWKSVYGCVHIKMIPWKICIFNPRSSRVIYPHKVCEMFVYKPTETTEFIKN